MANSKKDIIVITGGSGFLAQHLIREIQTSWPKNTQEIRIVDRKVFKKFLDYEDNIPIVEFIADCCEEKEILTAFKDATIVFHLAAREFCLDMYPNNKLTWRDNYIGTQVVLDVAKRCNVEYFIFTSHAFAAIEEDVQGGTEMNIAAKIPRKHVLGVYGKAKYQAEKLVQQANGQPLGNSGKTFKTMIISPVVLYGEGDNFLFPYVLRVGKQYGTLQKFGDYVSIFPQAYAGNVAHALICALEKLRDNWKELGAELFIVDEQHPPRNFYDFIRPLFDALNLKIADWSIYWMLAYAGMWVIEKFFQAFYLFGIKYPHNLPNSTVALITGGTYFTYFTSKARLVLDYKPKYSREDAVKTTVAWWKEHHKEFS